MIASTDNTSNVEVSETNKLPAGWVEIVVKYYFNEEQNISTWDRPSMPPVEHAEEKDPSSLLVKEEDGDKGTQSGEHLDKFADCGAPLHAVTTPAAHCVLNPLAASAMGTVRGGART